MGTSKYALLTSTLLLSMSAIAAPLKIVTVNAPAINCIFNNTCKMTATDTVSTFSWPSTIATTAEAKLQSRTFTSTPNSPAAGKTAYLYRLTALKGGSTDCVTGLVVKFGPVTQLDYAKSGNPADIFVVTTGGLGSVGIKSAEQQGNTITFNFSQAICNTVAQGTFFFGLTSPNQPKNMQVQAQILSGSGTKSMNTNAQVPA